MTPNSLVIFTDLDGSLLDHYDYSHAPVDDILKRLQAASIPVIPCTSKTRLECEALREELASNTPFIVENGAAILLPSTDITQPPKDCRLQGEFYIKNMVPDKAHWYPLLESLRRQFGDEFMTFDQAGIEGVMQMTGLDSVQAELACTREYGEILKWLGTQQRYLEFEREVEAAGAQLLRGGRFIHLTGDTDKGRALKWLMTFYQQQTMQSLFSIALGDSHNDVAMLKSADYAILIRSPAHALPEMADHEHLQVTEQLGPNGWAEGLSKLLATLSIDIN